MKPEKDQAPLQPLQEGKPIEEDILDSLKTIKQDEVIDKSKDLNEILDTVPGAVLKNQKKLEDIEVNSTEGLVFKKELDPIEKRHYEIVIKANKKAIQSLRDQVQSLISYIETLPETEESKKVIESLTTL